MRYCFGDYLFDTERYELHRAGVLVPLRPKECDVLAYLLAHRDRVVSKDELLEQVWPGQFVGDTTLHVRMLAVRKAIGDDGSTDHLLRTVRGRGYRFVAPVVAGDSPASETAGSPPAALLEKTPVGGILSTAEMEEPSAIVPPSTMPGAADTGEHKVVTVLCGELAEAADWAERLGAEAMHTLMQTLLAQVQHSVQRYGGTLVQVSGEGFAGLFGAPVAHEDHARRAVLAAVELRQRLQEEAVFSAQAFGKRVILRLGIHTGLLVVGTLSYTQQQLYTALGATTTLAAVLQQRANPDAILLSATTYELVQAEIHGMPAGTLDRAGQPAPLPIYTVQGVRQRHGGVPGRRHRPLTPYVGRERELTALHERLGRVVQGQGQVIGIVGEPGMGKSRLLYEFVQQVAKQAVTYYEGHCLPYGMTTPYGPILDVLRQYCRLPDRAAPAAVTAAVHRMLAAAGLAPAEAAPFLLQVLNGSGASEAFAELSPQARRVRTFALLRQMFLHTSRQQPVVLGIENGHWLDATSEEWLLSLVEQVSGVPFLLLVTYRPGYTPPWAGQSVATQIALTPLPSAASRVIVQSVARIMPLPEWRIQGIVAKAAGNPFFLEELTQTALEQDGEHATRLIPETIQAVLAARVDRLPSETKRLLQIAAVIGHDVPLELLQTVADYSETALHQHLRVLQHAELLYEKQAFPETVYTFKHALTHEVVYRSLLQERRRTLHARIVERLEALGATQPVDQIDRLAHHAVRGEVWDKAVTYCQQAGVRAHDRAAFREAVAAFEQALQAIAYLPDHSDTRVRAIEIRLALARPLTILGEHRRRLAMLGKAEALARALDDRTRLGWVLAEMVHGLMVTGDYDGAIVAGQQALELAAALGENALQGQASYYLGQAYIGIGDFGRAAECLRRNVETADLESDTPRTDMRLRSQAWLARTLSDLGAFAKGRRHGEEALRLATLAGRGDTPIVAHGCLGFLHLTQGDLDPAIQVWEQGLALCRASGDRAWLRGIVAGLGYAYGLQERLAEGRTLLEEAISESIYTGAPYVIAYARLSEVCRLAGCSEEAGQHAHQALDLARQLKQRGNEALALYQLGTVQAHADPPDIVQAAAHYQEALTLAEAFGMRPLQAHCHRSLGKLYSQIGRGEFAHAELTMAVHLYRTMDMTFWLPQAEAALAQVGMRGESMNAR
jgi:class 3 adenylate cyclase/DNA-binding winged helix-turn-helix (wHTH) protein/tetratricopeptide (TPR) repeat protein